MASPLEALRKMQERPSLPMVIGLGGATTLLFLAAVIGALAVGGDKTDQQVATAGTTETTSDLDIGSADVSDVADTGDDPSLGPTGTIKAGSAVPKGKTTPGSSGSSSARATVPDAPGDRTGISEKSFKWAIHAPVTFDGAPLNLAEDPIEGIKWYVQYLNSVGGVNGRKIEYSVFDDRYTVEGGKQAANAAVNDYKPFFVSGTLGVDQVAQVAAEAKKRKVPYIAGGGSENLFKDIGLFQSLASYDMHLELLAEFLAVESKKPESIYYNRKKIGVSALDSPYISPSVEVSFKRALEKNGLSLVKVVKVQKPTQQTTYATQIQGLKDAGVEIFVPAQDPITTGRMVAECVQQRCAWKYSTSNFAHESDTALQLMGGQWVGVRSLAPACYYINANEGDVSKCGQLKAAHEQWVKTDPDGQSGWEKDGQSGIAGYQFVHIWLKAMKDAGTDPTREKFRAALLTYVSYNDLVTAPITYKNSSNLAQGYKKVVILEAGADKWKQISPGFVDSF